MIIFQLKGHGNIYCIHMEKTGGEVYLHHAGTGSPVQEVNETNFPFPRIGELNLNKHKMNRLS